MSKFDVFFNFIRVFYPIDKLWMPLAFFQRFFKSFSLQMHYLHLFSTPLDSLLPPSFWPYSCPFDPLDWPSTISFPLLAPMADPNNWL
jgi:hypothetical protein